MTNAEMKKSLEKAGASAEEIKQIEDKFDIEKLEKLVKSARTPEEAIEAACKAFPDFNKNELKKQYSFYDDQYKAAVKEGKIQKAEQLTMEELNHVAGGANPGWEPWRKAVLAICIIAGFSLGVGSMMGMHAFMGIPLFQHIIAEHMVMGMMGGIVAATAAGIPLDTDYWNKYNPNPEQTK